jgi:hypothetical protein
LGVVLTHVLSTDPSYHPGVPTLIDPEDPSKGIKIGEPTIDDDATVFSYSPLDVFISAHIYDRASFLSQSGDGSTDMKTRINETNLDAVRFGINGIKNFIHPKTGNEVQAKFVDRFISGRLYKTLDDETMSMLDTYSIAELAQKIKDASTISKVTEKNSVSGSQPSA